MWYAVLLVLKIIGIILLILLGVLLLLIGAVLWIPMRYRVDIIKDEKVSLQGTISWCLSLIKVPITYDQSKDTEKLKVTLHVLGFQIKDFLKQEEKKKTTPKEKTKENNISKEVGDDQEQIFVQKENDIASEAEIPLKEKDDPDPNPEIQAEGKKRSVRDKYASIVKKIKNLKYTFQSFYDKIRLGVQKAGSFRTFIVLESTKAALGSCFGSVLILIKKLAPRHVRGWIHFGFDDPASTGQALGAVSVIYGYLPKKLQLIPDFEQQVLECELKVKGHIHASTVVRHGLRILLDKNVQNTYKKIKNGL